MANVYFSSPLMKKNKKVEAVAGSLDTILKIAQANKIKIPHECEDGECGSCMVKVTHLDGERQRSELALIRALLEREPGASVAVDFVPPGGGEARREEVELHGPGRRVTRAGVPILIGYRADANGEAASFYVLDVWLLSLFSYRREGAERHYSVLGLVNYSTGVGELETSL